MNFHEVKIKEHLFTLSARKTIFWSNKNTLLVSDLHLGKDNSEINFLEKLIEFENAVNEFNPKRLLILGDLIDAKCKLDLNPLKILFSKLKIEVILVLGNHDVFPIQKYLDLRISNVINEFKEDMFIFTHRPTVKNIKLNFHGHLHPAVKLKNGSKFACFYINNSYFCLPAFGGITGKHSITANTKTRIYIIEDNIIRPI